MTHKKLGVLAIAAALFAGACADPAGPSADKLQLNGANAALNPIAGYPFPSSNGTPRPNDGDGWVRLCKVSNVAGTFNFDFAVNGAVDGISDVSITVAAGQEGTRVCRSTPLYNSDAGAAAVDIVNIVEINPGADWSTTVDIDQYYQLGVPYHANALLDEFNVAPRTAKVYINDDLEKVAIFNNTFTAPPTGTEGCTPGYWKQDQHFDSWPAAYTQNTLINTALNTTIFPATMTLLQALNANGGGINALARHAAAALLNAASLGVDYPMTVADVQNAVDGTGTIEERKDAFATNNELGCPLN